MVEEKRGEILMQLMNKEVAMRLNAMEVDNPAKVQTRCSLRAQTKCVLTFIDVPPQVSRVRDQILAQRAHWRLNGPFNEQNLAELLKSMEVNISTHYSRICSSHSHHVCVQVTTDNTRGVALNRGRAFDDDDSDVDLDGL